MHSFRVFIVEKKGKWIKGCMYVFTVCRYVLSGTMSLDFCFIANGSFTGDHFCLFDHPGRVETRGRSLEEKAKERWAGVRKPLHHTGRVWVDG